MKRKYIRKIDPEVRNAVIIHSDEPFKVILYTKEYEQCRPALEKLGVKVTAELPLIDGYIVELPAGMIEKLALRKNISYIAADIDVQAQMNIATKAVGADAMHASGIRGQGVGIAILDTGIYPHPDFTMPGNRIAAFVDIVNGRNAPYDDNGHGTFVAGVAAGNGRESGGLYRGIAPDADIVALKVMDRDGGGRTSDVLTAMQWVADNHERYHIKVASLSLGASVTTFSRDDAMERGAEQLWRQGITVVVAAGNEGPSPMTITVPGTSRTLLTVGASDDHRTPAVNDDTVADFSSRGPVNQRPKPDLVAPGVNIVSTNAEVTYQPGRRLIKPSQFYTTMSGTSVSTPLVAGLAALLYQQQPKITPDQAKQELMKNAQRIVGTRNSAGSGEARIMAL